jgi:hypothetical protein
MMGTRWFNNDGLVVRFGTRTSTEDDENAKKVSTMGDVQTLKVVIPDLTALDTAANAVLAATGGIYAAGNYANGSTIPALSTIVGVRTRTDTVATGVGANLNVGTWTVSTTTGLLVNDKDPDGIVDDTDGDVAGYTPVGAVVTGAGALLLESVGTADVVIAPTYTTAAFTAGAVTIYIDYITAA